MSEVAQTCSEGLRLFERKADLALRPYRKNGRVMPRGGTILCDAL
jgi:hypothetical protein